MTPSPEELAIARRIQLESVQETRRTRLDAYMQALAGVGLDKLGARMKADMPQEEIDRLVVNMSKSLAAFALALMNRVDEIVK